MPTALRIEEIEFEKGCGTRLHCRRRVTKQHRQFGQSLLRRSRRVSLRWRGGRGRRCLRGGGGKGLRGQSARACREAATRLALVASECRRRLGSKAIEFERGCGTRLHCRRRVTKQHRQFGQSLIRRSRRVSLRWRGGRGRRCLRRGGGKALRGQSARACREAATRLALVASECRRRLGSKAIEFEKGCGTRLRCRRRVTKQRRQFGQSLLRRSRRV